MPWPQFEVDWKRAALVIIDMQNYGCNADVGLPQMLSERYPEIAHYYLPRVTETAVPNARRLVEGFRAASRRSGQAGRLFYPSHRGVPTSCFRPIATRSAAPRSIAA